MAISALVLGICSIVITFFFDAGFLIASPMAIVAIALGLLSGRASPAAEGDLRTNSKSTAKAGALAGGVALLLSAFWWVPFIRIEANLIRLSRPTTRVDVAALAMQVGSRGEAGDFVEVSGLVAGTQHLPGHATVALRSADTTDNWRVICAPLTGTLSSPEPSEGQPLVVRGRVQNFDTELSMIFGKQIQLDPCLVLK